MRLFGSIYIIRRKDLGKVIRDDVVIRGVIAKCARSVVKDYYQDQLEASLASRVTDGQVDAVVAQGKALVDQFAAGAKERLDARNATRGRRRAKCWCGQGGHYEGDHKPGEPTP